MPSPIPVPDQPVQFTMQRAGQAAPFRAMVHRLPTSEILLVALDMRGINGFRAALLRGLLWAGAVALSLGLIGAIVTGLGALGRIDRITLAIE
ncbi:MAG TPA: hypothetical protein VM782_18740 [Stellaceae bacterium]|nr:hypothetical protein [Stellaceae bacterium]